MPKPVAYYQKLLSSTEESINQSFEKLMNLTNGQDIKYEVNLKSFIENISSLELTPVLAKLREGIEVFNEIEKILTIEKKRQIYIEEMKKAHEEKEKKEDLNKKVRFSGFKRKSKLKIQSPKIATLEEPSGSKFAEATIQEVEIYDEEAIIEDQELD